MRKKHKKEKKGKKREKKRIRMKKSCNIIGKKKKKYITGRKQQLSLAETRVKFSVGVRTVGRGNGARHKTNENHRFRSLFQVVAPQRYSHPRFRILPSF